MKRADIEVLNSDGSVGSGFFIPFQQPRMTQAVVGRKVPGSMGIDLERADLTVSADVGDQINVRAGAHTDGAKWEEMGVSEERVFDIGFNRRLCGIEPLQLMGVSMDMSRCRRVRVRVVEVE